MGGPPKNPYQPYLKAHLQPKGAGDARPTASQVIKDCDLHGKLGDKTILITGCSSGLGVATASVLYAAGAKLLLTARNIPKLEEVIDNLVKTNLSAPASTPRPRAIAVDLSSIQSVREAAAVIRQESSKIDIFIANAGIMAVPYALTVDGFEQHMGVNHFAHALLFLELRPLLLAAYNQSGKPARVVSLSSSSHWNSGIRFKDMDWKYLPFTYNKWQAYGQSKTANIYMCSSITRHYGHKGITAVAVHPGNIQTELIRHLGQSDFAEFGDTADLSNNFYKNPDQGAATTVWATVSPHFDDVANGGRYLADVGESGPWDEKITKVDLAGSGYETWAYDEEKEERLWKLTLEKLGFAGEL